MPPTDNHHLPADTLLLTMLTLEPLEATAPHRQGQTATQLRLLDQLPLPSSPRISPLSTTMGAHRSQDTHQTLMPDLRILRAMITGSPRGPMVLIEDTLLNMAAVQYQMPPLCSLVLLASAPQ